MPFKWTICILSTVLLWGVSGCQSFIPKAQGLVPQQWNAQHYQRQDQVEVQWKTHSFSFLLYQQQQGKKVDLIALSLTGQQLFKLNFDGEKVQVEQRIDQMKLLPFDFLVRDILFATYPDFVKQHQQDGIQNKIQVVINGGQNGDPLIQEIWIDQQEILKIHRYKDRIELDNVQVPYQMIFSEVPNTLENNE